MSYSYYTKKELLRLGFRLLNGGINVKISKKANFNNISKIVFGNNVRIDDYCFISAHGNIIFDDFVHIARNCLLISAKDKIIHFHPFTGLSNNCSIFGQTDNYDGSSLTNPCIPDDPKYKNVIKGNVELKKHSIVGSSSIILPNTIIGEGTSVGALSLIKGNLEPWNIYAGNPLKLIKERKKDIIKLEEMFISNI